MSRLLTPRPSSRAPYLRQRSTAEQISNELSRNTILQGDAATRLRDLPDVSVDCVITSPPYFLLRNYGTRDQIGLESSVDEWV